MQSQPFSIVESYSEAPLLPGHLLAFNTERRTFGLHYLVGLRGSPRAWSQIGMILAGSSGMDPVMIELTRLVTDAFVWRQWQAVHFGDLEVLVDFRAQVKWVSVVVQIRVVSQT